MSSAIFARAAYDWAMMRRDYERHIEQAYNQAVEGTGGVLVNKLGRSLHIDGLTLFTGSKERAYRYASEELIEWWSHHSRITLATFEQQWVSSNERYAYVG